ncbi:tRNA (adenosine(37)-N6)-threonylcarbamoyltransferase complex ATPase subunit type 1 TsaE [Brachybacterium halotolerans subsp. kimchii]|uniref:tRNA (adenosine(37)-N6)-threonylcarbamoyltransferase complex ATPase subunit type 1 TsaE n=1 Tax=Brachybacterium halotolerans TaxID=2795215 RepID=UPI001E4FD600|nr:tRNA (adenosine(37)-N6)-threonylcarbamoyltransferase complex ATPase subunit type 1 TsaE [Brachybacterium halotolerans]UEJ82367.1 tRNA (adenosine(37)-N6)-threonylcarbamoyltransferase complex ATPase subunit type 1 TsaE [Brachybacterium halotolerans subsp. kimchii]
MSGAGAGPGAASLTFTTTGAASTRDLARRLAGRLGAGDLLVLDGPLGAGKTTFTQGLGEGLGVRGPVASPTFVISRVHPSEAGGPALVHVDAYRLGGGADIDDLDLDSDLSDAVMVVEWGRDVVEQLSDSHLLVELSRATGAEDAQPEQGTAAGDGEEFDEPRALTLTFVGPRWDDARIRAVREALGDAASTTTTEGREA